MAHGWEMYPQSFDPMSDIVESASSCHHCHVILTLIIRQITIKISVKNTDVKI